MNSLNTKGKYIEIWDTRISKNRGLHLYGMIPCLCYSQGNLKFGTDDRPVKPEENGFSDPFFSSVVGPFPLTETSNSAIPVSSYTDRKSPRRLYRVPQGFG